MRKPVVGFLLSINKRKENPKWQEIQAKTFVGVQWMTEHSFNILTVITSSVTQIQVA
jgi:hypothetical protein